MFSVRSVPTLPWPSFKDANCLWMIKQISWFSFWQNNGITVLINGHQIAQVHKIKYLGLYIDDETPIPVHV